jgi:gliding-associated putative ABC transporter substrate-binding component GldG
MLSRKLKSGSNALILALTVFFILVVVNFLSCQYFMRGDLTENKIYTLSKSTKDILEGLDDIVRIEAYFSKKPSRVAQIRADIKDKLDEYRAFSKGNLQIDFIDPGDDETLKQKLRLMGIPELQVNVREKDKLEVANVYMGIAVHYVNEKEVLPFVQETFNLEYDLSSAILKVTREETKTLGFLAGHGEFDIDNQRFQELRGELSKQYDVSKVEVKDGEPIDAKVVTLVIAGPQQQLTEREKYEIDQFIMHGGRTVFLIDPIRLQQGLQAVPVATGLNDLLEHYGVKLGNNLLLDRYHESATFDRGFMRVTQPYPYFVKAMKKNLSSESTITSQLESLVLPWPSSLELTLKENEETEGAGVAKVQGTVLATTSEFGWTAQAPYNLDPNSVLRPPSGQQKVHTLAVALSGTFKSFYAGKDIPVVERVETEEQVSEAEERTTKTESAPTQIIVVGTSQFLTQLRRDGRIFFQNTVDLLTLGDELIGIRSQTFTSRPLKETSDSERFLLKFLVIGGIPILVSIIGITRYFLRRRAKQLVEAYGKI